MVTLIYHKRLDGTDVFEAGTRRLIVEAGEQQVMALLWNSMTKAVDGIEIFSGIQNWDSDFSYMLHQSQLLNLRDLQTEVFLNTERMIPVPSALFQRESSSAQLSVLFPPPTQITYSGADVLFDSGMVICWEAPHPCVEILMGHFKMVRIQSLASLLVETITREEKKDSGGLIVIAPPWVWVLFYRSGELLNIQTVAMHHPENLSYHMLNLCKQWGVEPSETCWRVGGMLELNSPVWQATERFFEQVSVWNAQAGGGEVPGHFFAHYAQFLAARH